VWWDPTILNLNVEPRFGLHYEDILSQDEDGRADESLRRYEDWKTSRSSRLQQGSTPSLSVFIATDASEPPPGYADRVEIIQIPRTAPRPKGPRFGSLVHLVLRDASLTATKDSLSQLARTHGRPLAATQEEIEAAVVVVFNALQHSLFERARQSLRIYRELPVSLKTDTGSLFEGVLDLLFFESEKWIVTDFKTDADDLQRQARYRRQVGWYLYAMEKTTLVRAAAYLLHI